MAKNITANKLGILYCFAHFSVETACFYYLYHNTDIGYYWWIIALAYDALAFLPQTLLGVIADKFPKIRYGVIGFVMVLIALFLPFGWAGVIIIALGNALVHIDGAEKTLQNTNKKITPNAIFVGGGSFGVITGRLLGGMPNFYLVTFPAFLIIITIVLLFAFAHDKSVAKISDDKTNKLNSAPNVASEKIPETVLTLIIIFAVAVRGYIGYSIPTGWSVNNLHLIILYCYMGFGKMLGGVVTDKFGYKKATIISIAGALPFLLFGNTLPIISLTGVLLYSMSMPITVGIIYSKFPSSPGFAFGITTIGLFIGSLPEFFFSLPNLISQQIVVAVLSLIVLVLILISLKGEVKNV